MPSAGTGAGFLGSVDAGAACPAIPVHLPMIRMSSGSVMTLTCADVLAVHPRFAVLPVDVRTEQECVIAKVIGCRQAGRTGADDCRLRETRHLVQAQGG